MVLRIEDIDFEKLAKHINKHKKFHDANSNMEVVANYLFNKTFYNDATNLSAHEAIEKGFMTNEQEDSLIKKALDFLYEMRLI